MIKRALIIIDGQNDFTEGGKSATGATVPNGNLPVPGGFAALERVAEMIKKNPNAFDSIIVTLDSHHYYHVAHPLPWVDSKGTHPSPYTMITKDDVCGTKPIWFASKGMRKVPDVAGQITAQKKLEQYVTKLESAKRNGQPRYPLIIWPFHCIIGTPGAALNPALEEAIREYEMLKQWPVNKVTKGSWLFSEHYSALKAEVTDDADPGTHLNTYLINVFSTFDELYWCGLAEEFCLANTWRDAIDELGQDAGKKMKILSDGTAPVNAGGDTSMVDAFRKEATTANVEFIKCSDI
jgi:nicotinamidase-related amidase